MATEQNHPHAQRCEQADRPVEGGITTKDWAETATRRDRVSVCWRRRADDQGRDPLRVPARVGDPPEECPDEADRGAKFWHALARAGGENQAGRLAERRSDPGLGQRRELADGGLTEQPGQSPYHRHRPSVVGFGVLPEVAEGDFAGRDRRGRSGDRGLIGGEVGD